MGLPDAEAEFSCFGLEIKAIPMAIWELVASSTFRMGDRSAQLDEHVMDCGMHHPRWRQPRSGGSWGPAEVGEAPTRMPSLGSLRAAGENVHGVLEHPQRTSPYALGVEGESAGPGPAGTIGASLFRTTGDPTTERTGGGTCGMGGCCGIAQRSNMGRQADRDGSGAVGPASLLRAFWPTQWFHYTR
jgi:hypothetical protein